MEALFTLASLGTDSFLASLIIGAGGVSRREVFRCAAAFGLCDAAGSFVGAIGLQRLPPAAVLGVYLLCSLLLMCTLRPKRASLYALPVLLGLDNLCNGAPAVMAPALGASSAIMALLGLGLAAFARNRMFALQAER